ncbi:oligosaccharide flippase family protein [Bifidobacterium leontopitheci]|uniref:Polysaccharide biosynthesis protein n=1 Tax=Bifidobacterium leontopitheci TaxID=2650774 RepID=A0A6I1GL58_9BIFI|nr:oligosaccharide flippase family protein [Bifidobacterium leontopitheci]KAB7790336.1 polysaccharide biosynthesis protein [Bifidobacterium leontopitheci]
MRRGLIYSLSSNVIFFISGYVLHFFLGNTMPAASYGVVGTIITVLDFEYMFLSNGARQSLAKEISMKRFSALSVIGKTIAFQLIVIAFFFCVNFFGAPAFGYVLNDASLDFYFKVAAFLIPANGFFVILLGINDGLQQFGISALLGVIYPLAKLSAIPLVLIPFKDNPVVGVELGFLFALLASIIIGLILLTASRNRLKQTDGPAIAFPTVAKNTLSFSLFFIVVSLVLSVDTLVVKSVVRPAQMSGYYTGAVNFGKISYYLLSAFVTVILPVISNLVGAGKKEQAIVKAREIIVISLSFILPIAVIVSSSSNLLLTAFYGSDYRASAGALTCLSLSNFFMGMTVLLNMILNSHNSSRFSDVLSIASLLTIIPLFIFTAKHGGITAIAATSMTCTALLMLVSFIRVRQIIASVMSPSAWKAIGGAVILGVITYGIDLIVPHMNLLLVGALYILLYAVYIGALSLAKVITPTLIKSLAQ